MPIHLINDNIGVAGGIAPPGSDSKVPAENLPAGQGGTLIETHISMISLALPLTI